MNSAYSKISNPHRLLLNLLDKRNLKGIDKYVALSNFSICYIWKNKNIFNNNNKFNISAPTWNGDIFKMYQIFKIVTDNLSIRIYVNKMENRITFKIKTGYNLELLTPETMKLLGKTESKITKDDNFENVPHLEITEVVLVHCNIVYNN